MTELELFIDWAGPKGFTLDHTFMSTDGVPVNPFEDRDTKIAFDIWRAARSTLPEVVALTPEQITAPGWYYRADDDKYVKVETYRYPIMKSGLLPRVSGHLKEHHVERWENGLLCEGMAHRPDWGARFVGPLATPSPQLPKDKPLDEILGNKARK